MVWQPFFASTYWEGLALISVSLGRMDDALSLVSKAADAWEEDARTTVPTAEDIDRRIAERRARFDAAPVLQATLRFRDGTTRRVAVSKPTNEIDEPHIGEMFHAALVRQGVAASCEAWPVLVVDRRGRVVGEIPRG